MTDCQCHGPGFCERHKVQKGERWFQLCQTRDDYFQAWEAGTGPGQPKPQSVVKPPKKKPAGWGDAVTTALKKIGVTEEGYKAAKQLFGLPPTCGCAKRREWLNRVGEWWNGKGA